MSKNARNVNKIEAFLLDKIPVNAFDKFYNKSKSILELYNTYIQRRLLTKHSETLLKTVSEDLKPLYATLLKNQINHQLNEPKLNSLHGTSSISPKVMLNIAKKTIDSYSGLNALVGIQPLSGPVGVVFGMQYQSSNDDKLKLVISSFAVEAATRKLQAQYTLEAMADFDAMHVLFNKNQPKLDFEEEIASILGIEIGTEYVREILNELLNLAGTKRVYEAPANDDPILSDIWFNKFNSLINEVSNEIGRKTQRGCGNVIVVSPLVVSILQTSAKSKFAPSTQPSKGWKDLLHVGTLNGTIDVYSSLYVGDNILVGYKGSSQTDTGYIFAPYLTVKNTGVVVNPETFEPSMGFMTRYGKFTQTTPGQNTLETSMGYNYYGVINVSALGTIFDESTEESKSDLDIGEKILSE